MIKLQEVIIAEEKRIGTGKPEDPVRIVKQFWSKEGDLLGEVDPLAPVRCPKDGSFIAPRWAGVKTSDQ